MKKNLFILSVATLLMVGCDSSNTLENINPNEIRIVAKVDSTRATATAFEEGDKIALYAVEYDGDSVAELQVAGKRRMATRDLLLGFRNIEDYTM